MTPTQQRITADRARLHAREMQLGSRWLDPDRVAMREYRGKLDREWVAELARIEREKERKNG